MIFTWVLMLIPIFSFGNTHWEKTKHPFSVKVSVSSDTLTLKDNLVVELNATYPEDYNIDANTVRGHLLQQSGFETAPFRLSKETLYPPTEISQHILQQRFVFELDPLMTGIHYVSFFNLPFIKNNEVTEIYTYIFPIKVEAGTEEKIETMRAPLMNFDLTLPIELSPENRRHLLQNPAITQKEINRNQRRLEEKSLPWLVIATLCLAGLFIALSLRKQPKLETESEKQQRLKTIRETALENLAAIPSANTEEFYVGSTNVVRDYIEKKFGIPISSKTTEEFLRGLKTQPLFSESQQLLLEDFLDLADRVKFARYNPTDKEKENALNAAKNFIENT